MAETDIVVPIYNALHHVKKCVESVLRHTSGDFRLLLVDDASPDPEMGPYLDALESESEAVLVIRQSRNQGFVGASNAGMQKALDDGATFVCLLNSDVEVTRGWLDKMRECLLSHEKIATVSPLSNNATLCSVPVGMVDNPIPEGFDIDSFAEFVEACSTKAYPQVPSTVGFCLLTHGDLLREMGLFDGEAYGRGYCEENDLCLRATRLGFSHRIDDTTYVYHHGRASFGAETYDAFTKNYRVLCRRYPEYPDAIQRLIQRDELAPMRRRIVDSLARSIERKNLPQVLYVIHNDPFGDTIGGTTFHLRDVVDHLRGFDAWALYPVKGGLALSHCVAGASSASRVDLPSSADRNAWNMAIETLLQKRSFDVVHIHHMMGLPDHLFGDLRKIAKRLIMTLHDYWTMCPRYTLTHVSGAYCGVPKDLNVCDSCLGSAPSTRDTNIREYRTQSEEKFEATDCLVVPSDAAADTLALAFPSHRHKVKTIEHGMNWRAFGHKSRPRPKKSNPHKDSSTLRVAMLGYLAPQKGLKVVQRLIQANENSNIEWHLMGGEMRHLKLPGRYAGTIVAHGRYTRAHVIDLLRYHEIDVTLIPSIWPETYGYTLSESWAAGVPALVSHFGALGERVQKTGAGWVVDPENTVSILHLLNGIQGDPSVLVDKQKRVEEIPWIDAKENASAYGQLYRELLGLELLPS